ncbi:MAG: hypothetical protein M5R36_25760 [Deltaproteobacteria bacterium]|nr:hypothetical protein [Deltaproteobacteria bacterium]
MSAPRAHLFYIPRGRYRVSPVGGRRSCAHFFFPIIVLAALTTAFAGCGCVFQDDEEDGDTFDRVDGHCYEETQNGCSDISWCEVEAAIRALY